MNQSQTASWIVVCASTCDQLVEIQHLASRGKEPWRPRAKGDGRDADAGATCGCQVFDKPQQQSDSTVSGRQQSGKGRRGTTEIDEEAHGNTAMTLTSYENGNIVYITLKQ